MNITILNGNEDSTTFDSYIKALRSGLDECGHKVTELKVKDLSLKYCTGCFDCWTKTPGICDRDQASQEMDRAVINSDFTLWASPLKMGFPTALLKTALDKHLPLIHPYMVVDQGEAHHLKRYEKYPRVGLLVEEEQDTSQEDLNILREIFARTALNLKTRLEFLESTKSDPGALITKIQKPQSNSHLYSRKLLPIPGNLITPPSSMTVFNGSPRGNKGNTPIMLQEFQRGFGDDSQTHHLVKTRDIAKQLEAFKNAECVWLGFPLYTDCMPGLVKNFIEELDALSSQRNNPPIGFLVQSGFPEGTHSRYVERYLKKLADRLGSPYLGTIVKGNGEGTRLRSREMNEKLFDVLQSLGKGLAEVGQLDPEILQEIAKPERYPRILEPIFKAFLRTKLAHSYFDTMLVENGAFERRFDQPFINK
jgi:multimeric flavodoxin WrbA